MIREMGRATGFVFGAFVWIVPMANYAEAYNNVYAKRQILSFITHQSS
jgi:hypothetical protein